MSFIKALPTVLAKTANYTVTTNDGDNVHVNVDATAGATTITLYAASGNSGKIVSVKKTDSSAYAVTIDGNASETVDGATTVVLSNQYDSALLVCDGSNWQQLVMAPSADGLSQTFRGLTLRTSPNADVAATTVTLDHADEIVMHDGTRVATWDDLSAVITTSGAGGLDTGTEGASRWYSIHAIRKSSDGTKNLLLHRAKDYSKNQSFEDDSSNDNVRVGAADRVKLAQGFQITTAGPLAFVDIQINKSGSPTGQLWMTIESDSSGNPSGTALATSDKLDVAIVPTTRGWIRFVFRTPASLVTSTQYHIVLQGNWTMNGADVISWRGTAAGGYAYGSAKKYDGTNWAALASLTDVTFRVYVTQNDTALTMPSGYDQYAQVGWVYNNSSSNFIPFKTLDREAYYISIDLIAVNIGTATIQTLTDLAAFIPPTPTWLTKVVLEQGTSGSRVRLDGDLTANMYHGILWTAPAANALMEAAPNFLIDHQYFYYSVNSGTGTVYIRGYRW